MRKIGLYLILTFVFHLIGQSFWMMAIVYNAPIFGNKLTEDLVMWACFTASGIFGLISGTKLYKLR